jgi:hypothetical protein
MGRITNNVPLKIIFPLNYIALKKFFENHSFKLEVNFGNLKDNQAKN